jgi:predicted TPR repeat methyltransferase
LPLLASASTVATVSVVSDWDFLDATKSFYDTLACPYAGRLNTDLAKKPLDRAMLTAFAECVRTANAGPVADLGCGSGHVTAYLDGLGLSV